MFFPSDGAAPPRRLPGFRWAHPECVGPTVAVGPPPTNQVRIGEGCGGLSHEEVIQLSESPRVPHRWTHRRNKNQLRQKIGVVYGNPETTTGGNALKFYASVRLDIRKTQVVKNGDEVVGTKTRVKVVKNKVAPPFKEAHFEIRYGIGVYRVAEILDLAAEHGLVESAGGWFSFKGERFAQGRDRALAHLSEHPEMIEEIRLTLTEHAKAELQELVAPDGPLPVFPVASKNGASRAEVRA